MKYRAVLFDLDGTLLDTLADLGNSMNSVLARAGWPEHSLADYKYYIGDGVDNLVRRVLPENRRDAATINEYVAALREEYGRRWAEQSCPYPGIPDLLDTLQVRGLKMAILTNKMDDFAGRVVARLLPGWRFESVLGDRPGFPRKPDPAGALDIAVRLGLSPAEFLYLGDTGIDMQTARAAGMMAVGALWGFRPAEELRAGGAEVLIERPAELLRLL